MRKISTLLILLCISASAAVSQTADLGGPISFKGKIDDVSQFVSMPAFDLERMLEEDSINNISKSGPWRFGYKHDVDLNINNSGEWKTLPNGARIWRIGIQSRDALSINLIFDDFFLPDGARLHIYDAEKTQYIGAYTSRNNLPDHMLGTELVLSDRIIVEYYEPASAVGAGRLNIDEVVHGYKDVGNYAQNLARALNSSGDCNIDVNCPLGTGWEDQIRSVAMIVVNGSGICTGALVNNTCSDGTPYFLTADHCLSGATAPGSMSTWAFRFNWESPAGTESCATTSGSTDPGPPYDETMNGATLHAQNGNSDFALLEIDNLTLTDAQNWNLFFAGWDNSDANTVTEATGIHHPSGDVKKICQYSSNPTQVQWNGAATWGVADWTQGVTEPGSSGSPLFDQNGRIIGQLYGGSAACSGTNDNGAPDYYGRFGVSWNAIAGSANQLEPWLDACSSGATTDDGYDPNAPTSPDNAGITSVTSPTGTICGMTSFIPEVTLRNYGTNVLTSVDIIYDVDGANTQTYNWTGSLNPGTNTTVTLPSMTSTGGAHVFNATTSNPNGTTDTDPSNDANLSNFTIVTTGSEVTIEINTDCWGYEVYWELVDQSGGSVVATGGNQNLAGTGGGQQIANSGDPGSYGDETLVTEILCLPDGCYDFVIYDDWGDGMNGDGSFGCTTNGDYTIYDDQGGVLAQLQAANAAYGNSETSSFCLVTALTADFGASSTSVCEGGTIDFSDLSSPGGSPITSWSWSFQGGTPATSTAQNPTGIVYNIPGTYDVTLTVDDGSTTDTKSVTGYIVVNENPVVMATGTDITCFGSGDGTATATATGGATPYDYAWTPSGSSGATVTGLGSGTHMVTVTDNNGCTAQASVMINEPTAVAISSTTETQASCGSADGSTTISASGGTGSLEYSIDGATYQAGSTISGLAVGSYTVYVRDANGCLDTTQISITNPNAPSVTSNTIDETCSGDCDGEATANVSGGTSPYTYSWTSGGTAATETGLCAGSYDVTVTDAAGCTSVETVMVVATGTTPTADATASSTTIYLGQQSGMVSFTDNSSNAGSYSWDFDDGNTSTQQSPSHTYTAPGTYIVTLTVTNGNCTDTWIQTIIVIDDTGVEEQELASQVSIFPNPSNGNFTIRIDELSGEPIEIRIVDIRGKLIGQERYANVSGDLTHKVEMNNEADGVYFVRVIRGKSISNFRIIKQ